MSEIRKGARVRVTYEGVVNYDHFDEDKWISLKSDAGETRFARTPDVEVLAPPKRELEDGAYYLHPNGIAYKYDKARDRFSCAAWMKATAEITTTRDQLIKLIPEEA